MRAKLLLVLFAICIISAAVFSGFQYFAFAQESEKPDKDPDNQRAEKAQKVEERQAKLEEKKEKINQKAAEKAQKIREKQEELRQEIQKIQTIEKIPPQKAEKVKERLYEKIDKLNQKTASILEKVQEGKYLGKRLGSNPSVNFTINFVDVQAKAIGNDTATATLDGNLNMTTFDVGKKNLKFEVTSCDIEVGDIEYMCGFGKARTISSGANGIKDSLVIVAFLEDSILNQLHTTLKIFLQTDQPIMKTSDNTVSILGPQSVVSHQWFLNGTAQLLKVEGQFDELEIEDIEEEPQGRNLTINIEESIGISTSP